jgi:hypothetical protein
MLPREAVDHGGEQAGRYVLGTADAQLSNRRIGKEFEFLQALRQLVENDNTAPDEGATVSSRFNAIAAAIEHAKPQFVLGLTARQSTSVLICSGLTCSPAGLRAINFDSFISENRNYAVNVCSSDTNKNTNKTGDWIRMRTNRDE